MSGLADAHRFVQTVRHLRFVQFYGRLRYRIVRPTPDPAPAPPLRPAGHAFILPAQRRPSLIGARDFRLLNQSANLDEIGWNGPAMDRLWRYNQQYFDDLNADGADTRHGWHLGLLADWIAHNPPGQGTGWEPYPVSLRIVNWIKWALRGNALPPEGLHSLAVQARWLMRRLEWHLLGNHLFANAKALVFAGLFFDGADARQWLDKGLAILARELPEQILPDGGQFELSPMYHALALEDVLDLVNVFRAYDGVAGDTARAVRLACERRVPLMQHWLRVMCHPDGDIAFFNDAACGVAPSPRALMAYADRLGFDAGPDVQDQLLLPDSGYARYAGGGVVLIADMGRIGPDYLPGHAHADTLSFELSFRQQRIFVNSGISLYGVGAERLHQRGTAAHNSVTVDGQNSSDVWHGFRVGRRARPIGARISGGDGSWSAEAAHDGYRHLPGRPVHHRRWTVTPGRLVIDDHVSAPHHVSRASYHLHPDVKIRRSGGDHGVLILPDGTEMSWRAPGLSVDVGEASWHPEFGMSIANACIVVPLREGRATFELSWI